MIATKRRKYNEQNQFYDARGDCFNPDGSLDVQGNKNVYEHLIKGGVDGIVVMGSTGEFFSMSMQDKKKLVDVAAKTIRPHPAADRRQLHGLARDRGTGNYAPSTRAPRP